MLFRSGIGANAEAGLRSASANSAIQQAFQQAIANASGQAGIITGSFTPGITAANQLAGSAPSGVAQAQQLANLGGSLGIGIPGKTPGQPIGNFQQQFPPGGQFPSGFGTR